MPASRSRRTCRNYRSRDADRDTGRVLTIRGDSGKEGGQPVVHWGTKDRQGASMRTFDLGTVLSVTTGRLVAPNGMDDLYDILNFLTGDNLFTHVLPRANRWAAPLLLAQFPRLANVDVVAL